MKCIDHIKLIKDISNTDLCSFALIERKVKEKFSDISVAEEYVSEIIQLFHKAFQIDQHTFVKDILFQNQLIIRNTQGNQDYIFEQLELAKKLSVTQKQQIQLVNIYRNIISDIFEPYLSILVASIHLLEGTFQSFLHSNLSANESNKYNFAYSRLKPTNLFKGYFPIIRNAVSHTGSHSITYQDDNIIFKKIKRGQQPEIEGYLILSTLELIQNIQNLIDFTQSIEVAINIFGVDVNDLIISSISLSQEFFEQLMTSELLLKGRKIRDDQFKEIWSSSAITLSEKYEHFAKMFTGGCEKYQMPALSLRFKEEEKILIITIPFKEIDFGLKQKVIKRVAELIRYCILAEQYFHFSFDSYLVEEEQEGKDKMQVWLKGVDIKEYSEGNASFYDLIHDGNIYKNCIDLPIMIDFKELNDSELKSLKNSRVHKKR